MRITPNPWIGLDRLVLWLARRLLFSWAKTTVAPHEPRTLLGDGLQNGLQPVFYVLEMRSFADLLVLEQQCRRAGLPRPTARFASGNLNMPRTVFALKRQPGLFRASRSPRIHSATLAALLATAADNPEFEVQLLPVSIFWGQSPYKERGWFKILFSDSWVLVGRLRKFFIILMHGRNIWVRFSPPVSLRRFVDEVGGDERAVHKLSRVLQVHFRQLRTATLGPQLSHRDTLVNGIVSSTAVGLAVREEMAEKGLSEVKARALARRYADEIAADVSYPFIILLYRLLRRLWDRLYDGVEVGHIEVLQQVAPGNEVIYIPCHRSHTDYLLLSYVLYAHGIALPHVAAGINLNLPVIGRLLRLGGAFFLRRSFKGERLYAAVFNEYLATILGRGVAIEYFIEGGRSRSGRSLQPKPGMLDMTVRGYFRNRQRPVVFVPVYIGYEKLIEGRGYVAELAGAAKKKESLLGFFKSLRALRSRFGRVYLNFGESLHLDMLLAKSRPDWRKEIGAATNRPDWLPTVIEELGQDLIIRINSCAAVNPINLLALVLLSTPKHAMGETDLAQQLDVYVSLLKTSPYSPWCTIPAMDGRGMIAYAEDMGAVQRCAHALGDIIVLDANKAVLMTYFRNNIVHLLSLPAIVACCFLNAPSMPLKKIIRVATLVYPFIRSELFLRWSEDELTQALREAVDALVKHKLLHRELFGNRLRPPPASSIEAMRLKVLARSVVHTFERFYITVALLLKNGPHTVSQTELERQSQLMAQRLSLLYGFNAPEFFDQTLFHNFIQTLREREMLAVDDQGLLAFDESFGVGYGDARLVLSEEVRHSIRLLAEEAG